MLEKPKQMLLLSLKKGSNVSEGETWNCRVLSIKENYVVVKPLTKIKSAKENEAQVVKKLEGLINKFKI